MKKIISIMCCVAIMFTFCSCTKSYKGQTITGMVSAIDGNKVTLVIGTWEENEAMPEAGEDAEMGEMAADGTAPAKPEGEASNGDATEADAAAKSEGNAEGNTNGDAPEMPADGTAPAKPEGEESNGDAAAADSSAKPEGNAEGNTNGNPPEMPADGTMPAMPDEATKDGDAEASDEDGETTDEEMPTGEDDLNHYLFSGTFTEGTESVKFDLSDATITCESMTGDTEATIEDIAVDSIITISVGNNNKVLTCIIRMTDFNPGDFDSEDMKQDDNFDPSSNPGESSDTVEQGTAANTIETEGTYSDTTYTSTGDDENALRIAETKATFENITVEKTEGSSSDTENGDFYGVNAAVLVTNNATAVIKNSTVTSSVKNGNGIFSYGTGTTTTIYDTTITTTGDNSGGIQTTGGATTNASNLTVTTNGASSAAIRSDRGGGTVTVKNGTYTSNGLNSPAIYSTADIAVKEATLTANDSEALVIEGKNSISLQDCVVSGNMNKTKSTAADINIHNVMIYQSMSGDADVGTSTFTMTGGSLTSNSGDMIYVTNTTAVISLSGVTLKNNDTDVDLLVVTGNNASHGWGTAGSNGAQATVTFDGQEAEGSIVVDTISTLDLTLKGNSNFTGTINVTDNAEGGTAVSDNAVITVESGSTWTLTGNCVISSLTNNGTINYNGFTITLADGTVLSK